MPESIVETVRLSRRKEEGARAHVHLSFPIGEANEATFLKISRQIGNVIGVSFSEIQASLADVMPSPKKTLIKNAQGEVVLPHSFKASEEDTAKCTICGFGESLEVHQEQSAIDKQADALIAGIDGPDRVEPASEAEEAEQQQAEAALAGRSRNGR